MPPRRFNRIETGGLPVAGLALSPGGGTLAACFAATVVLADAPDYALPRGLDAPGEAVRDVAFSPDGTRLAAACDGAVRVFEVAGGAGRVFGAGGDGFHTVAWSPDGALVAAGHYEPPVALFDAGRGDLITTLDPGLFDDEGRTRVTFSPDGELLASTAYNRVLLWSLAEVLTGGGRPRVRRLGGRGHAHMVDAAFSPDGATVVALSEAEGDCALHLWEAGSGRERGRVRLPHYATRLACLPGGRLVAVAEGGGDGLSLWDADTGARAPSTFGGAAGLDFGALATDIQSRLVVAGTRAGEVFGWRVAEA